ncbi:MAG: hypothetical protein COS14_11980 [Bacteroidetes bacterium CG02_land_8_20_14_3_00_31_25]|nr:hypothetical protein [Bacteroidota bacterium]PIV57985.1 MAG: hypothetical protein COS14_11980 [Bacteroidetes bacterium CG02_land_8_20_14_3_00_31_25]
MKYLIFIFLFIALNNIVYCQKDSLRLNSVFIEIDDFFRRLSINYDRKIPFNNKVGLDIGCGFSVRTGLDYTDAGPIRYVSSYRFPIQTKIYYQFKKHTFDLGCTVTPYISRMFEFTSFERGVLIWGGIGYKYSIFNNMCYIGISLYPIYWNSYDGKFTFFLLCDALRFGYKF